MDFLLDNSCKEKGKKSVKRTGEYLFKIHEKRKRQINICRTNNLQWNENICLIYTKILAYDGIFNRHIRYP
jgi:hypothetical protein